MTRYRMHTKYHDRRRIDESSVFTSQQWKQRINLVGVTLRLSEIRAHRMIGIRERLHLTLKRIYQKIKVAHPLINPMYLAFRFFYCMNLNTYSTQSKE